MSQVDARVGWAEKAWALSVVGAAALFFAVLTCSVSSGALGIVREDGHFVLRQGRAEAPVDQLFGLVFFTLTRLFAVSILVALVLTLLVFARHGTLRASEILRAERGRQSTLEWLVSMVWLLGLLPAIALLLRAILR